MPLMTLVLLASVLPRYFPFQYLGTRDRHYFRRELFETLEWRFDFDRLGVLHVSDSSTQCFGRNAYTTDVPTATMIKSVRTNRSQSIREKTPDSVNRNAS